MLMQRSTWLSDDDCHRTIFRPTAHWQQRCSWLKVAAKVGSTERELLRGGAVECDALGLLDAVCHVQKTGMVSSPIEILSDTPGEQSRGLKYSYYHAFLAPKPTVSVFMCHLWNWWKNFLCLKVCSYLTNLIGLILVQHPLLFTRTWNRILNQLIFSQTTRNLWSSLWEVDSSSDT
jgi:hypothetical protein